MDNGFQRVLSHIRSISNTETEKGRLFERLMKQYFLLDPVYQDRFSNVWLWSEWANTRVDFTGNDTGIDLVAESRYGGYCAIQCKCYSSDTVISKKDLDSFISASNREPFTERIIVDTGDSWGPNARKTINGLKPECSVLRFGDLINRPFDWPDLVQDDPEDLKYRPEPFELRPHQKKAFDSVIRGFKLNDRGKLIMACGTGKTFTALRIAESVAGKGGRVLYLVPSISLFQQSMREWAEQRKIKHRYIGICSDTRAGRNDEDASLEELEIPVTTRLEAIVKALHVEDMDAVTVVFCTYQSLALIEEAQKLGAPLFDLILCDEAHRTTGIEKPDDKTSPFVLVHDTARILANKRLYMTATPRLYTESAKSKAAQHEVEVFSMDDEVTYGPEFYRLPFSKAVEQDLLSDYKVVVFALSEEHVDAALQAHLAAKGGEINISDAAKIIGCWAVIQNPEDAKSNDGPIQSVRRAIAFTNIIKSSKLLEEHWDGVVNQAIQMLPEDKRKNAFHCRVRHVDGQHHALDRKSRIEWLKENSEEDCRILTNARCLSEGIDVPALDAVLFINPRNSHVDIVQAVGRAMRKSPGKEIGYIVLPVAVPVGVDPAQALNDNERFAAVWGVLRALRSHDDRFDAEINQIDLNNNPTDRIVIFSPDDGTSEIDPNPIHPELPFPPLELPPGAIYAKIVEKCGDRKYWENWAKDVADIFAKLKVRIEGLLNNTEHATLREWFKAFHDELKISINESIDRGVAIDMMAQHILTRPVFDALFEGYDFASSNPVAKALDALKQDFGEFGLENEVRDLESFYESVRLRARGIDNSEGRQTVLIDLYEKFFKTAIKKDAERLGIVYTPVEVVDFILHSADFVLREEFGRSLSDEGVHILDPFTGTGRFLVRLLQSNMISDSDLERKYKNELHANEIVLLAYYIAAIHVEEAYHGRRGMNLDYDSFKGIILTDTFNLHTDRTEFPMNWLPANSERVERQQKMPIQVIIGNPPWSAGQRSAADNNKNVEYPQLNLRIKRTYVERSSVTNKNSLYDTYKLAIRWATDRIGEDGVIAFVTNGSWIDGNADAGLRACLAEEFSSIYVLNLRGNQRTQGQRSHQEGGKIFGQGSRAPVAITLMIKNPNVKSKNCKIRYWDIGDYLSREEKLKILSDLKSIEAVDNWQEITPDSSHDWVKKRAPEYQKYYPLGTKEVKAGKADNAIFHLYSQGYKTGRDVYTYNFDVSSCLSSASAMVQDYSSALNEIESLSKSATTPRDIDNIVLKHSKNVRWDRELKNNLKRKKKISYSVNKICDVHYRPFVKQHGYIEYLLAHCKYQMDRIFPANDFENKAICVPGIGSSQAFTSFMVDKMPDLGLLSACQCFPRYQYLLQKNSQQSLFDEQHEYERVDNITDTALKKFRVHYQDSAITKGEIFNYVYAILHAPAYCTRFANDLSKDLPRIPLILKFRDFAEDGEKLADLHLGYENCIKYELNHIFTTPPPPFSNRDSSVQKILPEWYQLGTKKMRFVDSKKTTLAINDYVQLAGIPSEAHDYQVNGRTPIEWFIDRYHIKKDRESGIVNDPNGWFDSPSDIVAAIERIVFVSVETVKIVKRIEERYNAVEENMG